MRSRPISPLLLSRSQAGTSRKLAAGEERRTAQPGMENSWKRLLQNKSLEHVCEVCVRCVCVCVCVLSVCVCESVI